MSETQEETGENKPDGNDEGGNLPKTTPLIEGANAVAERLEAANKRTEELLKKQEELQAYDKLGGTTDGRPQEETPKEDSPQEYAKKVLANNL